MTTASKPKNASLTVTIPEDLAAQLRDAADARMVNPSLLVTKALEGYLASLVPVETLLAVAPLGDGTPKRAVSDGPQA